AVENRFRTILCEVPAFILVEPATTSLPVSTRMRWRAASNSGATGLLATPIVTAPAAEAARSAPIVKGVVPLAARPMTTSLARICTSVMAFAPAASLSSAPSELPTVHGGLGRLKIPRGPQASHGWAPTGRRPARRYVLTCRLRHRRSARRAAAQALRLRLLQQSHQARREPRRPPQAGPRTWTRSSHSPTRNRGRRSGGRFARCSWSCLGYAVMHQSRTLIPSCRPPAREATRHPLP